MRRVNIGNVLGLNHIPKPHPPEPLPDQAGSPAAPQNVQMVTVELCGNMTYNSPAGAKLLKLLF